jgi:hypothetical protein
MTTQSQPPESRPPGRMSGENCPQCGRPIDPPGPRVTQKKFCSARCRSQWHAKERQRAWERYEAEKRK